MRCADGVSLPSVYPTRVPWRKLWYPGCYGNEERLRLATEHGKSFSVRSGGIARLSSEQAPLASIR